MQRNPTPNKAERRKVALITGATSGIGKAFAVEYARQGYDLILTGRRIVILGQVAEMLQNTYHVSCEVIMADLTEEPGMDRVIRAIEKQPDLEVLVNNAGYGIGKMFHEDAVMNQLDMIKVHITAPLKFIHKALPMMIKKEKGTIINVSSLAAFTPARTNIMYASTKAFMLNFSESLYLEARRHGIRMQCLCPGYTHSDFHTRLGPSAFPRSMKMIRWMEPDEVVRYSMRCLKRGKLRCIPGWLNRIMVMLIQIAPRRVYYAFADMQQQESGSDKRVSIDKRRLQRTGAM